jgi:hypothetical protein
MTILDYQEPSPLDRAFRRRLWIAVPLLALLAAAMSGYVLFNSTPRRSIPPYIPSKEWLDKRVSYVDRDHKWYGAVKGRAGDEIWLFRSPPETWRQEWGTGGECLIRNGVIVDGRVTVVN